MDRREFVAAGIGGALSAEDIRDGAPAPAQGSVRASFQRLGYETFLNAAGGTPLGSFAEEGLQRYLDFQRLGPGRGRGEYVAGMLAAIRGLFAQLVGARPSEVALVHCTKAGEQLVIDALDPMRSGHNIVTNDLHFSGSLHNLVGLQRAGADVRIVRHRGWNVPLDDMAAAIDDQTALVAVSLVSNVNGRIEPMRELADLAHEHGALVYADIIQAAGVVPVDLRALGIDFAACNGYKWLYGVHGAGFLFVREELQGATLPDRLFPGHVQHNYHPWVAAADPERGPFGYVARGDASRYEPGHVSYLGYCALYESLKFILRLGVDFALRHSVRLHRRLIDRLDPDRYRCISPHVDRSPIVTFITPDAVALEPRLRAGNVVVSLGESRLRVSAAVYNNENDVDRVADILNREE